MKGQRRGRGRPPTRELWWEEKCRLAGLIDDALKAGQRGDGTPKPWLPWKPMDFAAEVNTGVSSVSDWRDRENPTRPGNIMPILKAFYGDIPAYAEAKQAMLTAWKRASGIDADDPPEPRRITPTQFSDIVEVVTLLVNQDPTPDNHGTLTVPYTLRLRCDDNVEVPIKVKGQAVTVTMEIGLTAPLFVVESGEWQPMEETIFRKGQHPNIKPGPFGDSVLVTGPADNHGRIVGEPLKDVPHLLMEKTGQDGAVTLSVKVPRDGFRVILPDQPPLSATQKDVLDAIFAQGIPRDAKNRLEVAKVQVTPNAPKAWP